MYVLIVFFLTINSSATEGGRHVGVAMQEFSSKGTCEVALAKVENMKASGVCVPK